jgi:hypothetical protein
MKFRCNWSIPHDTWLPVLEKFNDAAAVQRYLGQWNPHMEIDLAPVLDDAEAAAVYRQILTANND